MPTWPVSLPQTPPINGVQIGGPRNAFARTEMDQGPPQTRRLTTAAPQPMTLTFTQLTQAQVATFEAFFENDLAGGSLSFDMPHPITDATKTTRFTNPNAPYSLAHSTRQEFQLTINVEMS